MPKLSDISAQHPWLPGRARRYGGALLLGLLVVGYQYYRNATRSLGNEPLYEAIERGDARRVDELLAAGADPNSQRRAAPEYTGHLDRRTGRRDSYYSHTPLTLALAQRRYAIAGQLLARGARVQAPGPLQASALELALQAADTTALRLLLSHGANPNGPDRTGVPLLFAAGKLPDPAPLRQLLSHGADPNVPDPTGRGATYTLHSTWSAVDDPNPAPAAWAGVTPLMAAARGGNLAALRLLLAHGARLDAPTRQGQTALMLAAEQNRVGAVQLLLERGADPRRRDRRGRRARDYTDFWTEEAGPELARLLGAASH